MTKLLCGLLAAAAIAALAGTGAAPAQDKKKAAAGGATIELNQGKDGKYRFTIRDADGKYLAGNIVGFATKDDAVKALENLKTVLPTAKVVDGKESKKAEKADKK